LQETLLQTDLLKDEVELLLLMVLQRWEKILMQIERDPLLWVQEHMLREKTLQQWDRQHELGKRLLQQWDLVQPLVERLHL
jgi:hypothetical protein